jgi:hypothetical protein
MFGIDGGLHVVRRGDASRHAHKADFRLGMLLQLLDGRLHGGRIDTCLLLLVGLFHAFKITTERIALTYVVAVGDGAELAAVHGHPLATDQAAGASEAHQLRARDGDGLCVHPTELGDGLVIGIQPAQKPHQLHVAATLRLQPAR